MKRLQFLLILILILSCIGCSVSGPQSHSPNPTNMTTPQETVAQPGLKIVEAKQISITQLLDQMGDRYHIGSNERVRIVKRNDIAYYNWFSELHVYDGNKDQMVLENVDCKWMYIDENSNLWFAVEGDIGIVSKTVKHWTYVFRYDSGKESFKLVLSESRNRCIHGMFRSFILFNDNGTLKSCDTKNNSIRSIDTVSGNMLQIMENQADIYYQNGRSQYVLLSGYGESIQTKTILDLNNFPNRRFDTTSYFVDYDKEILYRFERTKYIEECSIDEKFYWFSGDECQPYIIGTDYGLCFANSVGAYIDCFDIKTRSWFILGDPMQDTLEWPYFVDGQLWFISWKPAVIGRIKDGNFEKFDLSGVMEQCSFTGYVNGFVFLSNNNYFDDFSHVFNPENKTFYQVFPPSEETEEDGA